MADQIKVALAQRIREAIEQALPPETYEVTEVTLLVTQVRYKHPTQGAPRYFTVKLSEAW